MNISKQGFSTIAVVMGISSALLVISFLLPTVAQWIIWMILLIVNALVVFFFRDPDRVVPEDPALILAPADGKIVSIRIENEHEYFQKPVRCISIFLSPLDVHINRVPVSGSVDYVKYYPGKFLMAWKEEASLENERAHFVVRRQDGLQVMFKQITGFLARRIVYNLKEGTEVVAGQRFGLMKFSSRMDVLLPEDIAIEVTEGDRTTAGETILARWQP